jgi:hypothetical protein
MSGTRVSRNARTRSRATGDASPLSSGPRILTPELASQWLDAWGPPRHLEGRREVTLNECRRFLRGDPNGDYRVASTAKKLRLSTQTVGAVWALMLRETP